jgi:hypothetical protein
MSGRNWHYQHYLLYIGYKTSLASSPQHFSFVLQKISTISKEYFLELLDDKPGSHKKTHSCYLKDMPAGAKNDAQHYPFLGSASSVLNTRSVRTATSYQSQ